MEVHLLPQLITERAQKHPDKPAVLFNGTMLTFSELEVKSNQLSVVLSNQGVKKGDRVGILLNKSIESVVALFGIMKAGAVYVPLDPRAPAARIGAIIGNCGIAAIVASADLLVNALSDSHARNSLRKAVLAGPQSPREPSDLSGVDWLPWDALSPAPGDARAILHMPDTQPAYILHTSGSTGVPKGVVISHVNALSFVNMAVKFFTIGESDRIANHAPIHFDLSVFDIFGAIRAGSSIVLVPEFLSTFPVKLAEFIDHESITIWNSTSSVLAMLAQRGKLERFKYAALRLIHFSGDVMPVKYLRILKKSMANAQCYNIYGQTEANSSLFYHVDVVPDNDIWKIPIGKPFPNFEAYALDDENKEISNPGRPGELYVNASTVALGYWNDEEKTREKFGRDPRHGLWDARVFRTGDLVELDAEGNFVFLGRKDHMVKSRGYRIELSEIEIVLNNHPAISLAVATAVPDEVNGTRIIGFVSLAEGARKSAGDIAAYCHGILPHYMVPEEIVMLRDLPRTSSGKVDRKLITENYLAGLRK